MKKILVSLLLILLLATPCFSQTMGPKVYVYQSTNCSFLTWYGALCHDTDDGKLYKWNGTTQEEVVGASGDITVGTINAGAGGFLVDADGDTTAKSMTITRQAGVTSQIDLYEIPANGDNKVTIKPADSLAADYVLTLPSVTSTLTSTIVSGAKALATAEIASAACTAAQTDTATGTLTTDVVSASFNGDPTAVTGYVPLTTGMLTIIVYPTANTVNFKVCNNTAAPISPGAITLNWRVTR